MPDTFDCKFHGWIYLILSVHSTVFSHLIIQGILYLVTMSSGLTNLAIWWNFWKLTMSICNWLFFFLIRISFLLFSWLEDTIVLYIGYLYIKKLEWIVFSVDYKCSPYCSIFLLINTAKTDNLFCNSVTVENLKVYNICIRLRFLF